MNIDIEAIVREEVRSFIRENLTINNVPNETVEVTVNTKRKSSRAKANIVWEFAPASGRRRTPEEMVLHKLEKKHGRLLTPEEKGEARATSQIAETTENDVREAVIKKDRIDKIAAEGMAAASKELAEEGIEIHYEAETKEEKEEVEELKSQYPDSDNLKEPEATIPKTEELKNLDSLFS
jgi:hypothetical protein